MDLWDYQLLRCETPAIGLMTWWHKRDLSAGDSLRHDRDFFEFGAWLDPLLGVRSVSTVDLPQSPPALDCLQPSNNELQAVRSQRASCGFACFVTEAGRLSGHRETLLLGNVRAAQVNILQRCDQTVVAEYPGKGTQCSAHLDERAELGPGINPVRQGLLMDAPSCAEMRKERFGLNRSCSGICEG